MWRGQTTCWATLNGASAASVTQGTSAAACAAAAATRATPAPACCACRTLRRRPSSWAAAYKQHYSLKHRPPLSLQQLPHPKLSHQSFFSPQSPFLPPSPPLKADLNPGLSRLHFLPDWTAFETPACPHPVLHQRTILMASHAPHRANQTSGIEKTLQRSVLQQLSARECYHTMSHCLCFYASRAMGRST